MTKQQSTSLADFMQQHKTELLELLPRAMPPERFIRSALLAVQRNPELAKCSLASIWAALQQAAQLGLEVGYLQQAYLVPFWDKRKGTYEAQFMIGYLGLRDLAERYGDVIDFDAQAVRAGDVFDYELGTETRLVHKPALADRGEITHFYAWARPRTGSLKVCVMTRAEIDDHRDRFARKDDQGRVIGPWATHYEAMALKTVIRRLSKFLARSPELRTAIALDEMAEAEVPQRLGHELLAEQTAVARAQNAAAMAALQASQSAPTDDQSRPEPTDDEEEESEELRTQEEPHESDDALRQTLAELVAQASASPKGRAVLRGLKLSDASSYPAEQLPFAIDRLRRALT